MSDRCDYKTIHSFNKRKEDASRIISKYPDRIPIIVQKSKHGGTIPMIDKKKYLAPSDLTMGQFIFVIRKRMRLPPENALFMFVNNIIPPTASTLSSIYENQKDDDGFLYFTYSGENTFGYLDNL